MCKSKQRVDTLSQGKTITELVNEAKSSILDFDEKGAEKAAKEALELGYDINEIIEKGFLEGMKAIGDMFEEGNACLLHIFAAADTMDAGIAVFEDCEEYNKLSKNMAIELVREDQRDDKIDVLETMFRINGYDVVEIPDDISIVDFLEKDKAFVSIPDSCKAEIMEKIAANPGITTFQLSEM
ncbi:B12-binding domain-containing protein [Methanolobus bombayensis]|uniref:B12-binding domain-containing protein n=1 Tax=Methanolobus bombayensis TaxID=38023 RepID=UPI001AE95740|nr:B12-binding domain-containing protein [Methanolobus bombayensis]MBP1907830.1 methanogenic corrinoid protein MtbC1 [Methanolobus bombayensis]